MTKIYTIAHVPEELAQAWVQHLRNFDTQHPGCHFEVLADFGQAEVGMRQMLDALKVEPEIPFRAFYRRKP
ncbi:MAG TPA: hypothetical protein VF821_22160 [Lentzea sp.]